MHLLAAYSPLFLRLDRGNTEVFSYISDIQYSELQDIEHAAQDFLDKCQENASSLELTAPLKLPVLPSHILDFRRIHRATTAAYVEQDGEPAGRVFSRLMDTFPMLGPKALCHTVTVFNARRF